MVTASGGALGAPPITPINWTPKINDRKPPGPGSEGMTWIPGGEFWMGSQEDRMTDAKPWHRVYVDGYWMDKTAVTNEQFARFVKATGYVTVAERKPRAEDYPQAPPEKLVAGSAVFSPPDHPVELDSQFRWWSYVQGANWRHPEGPKSNITERMNHPVVPHRVRGRDGLLEVGRETPSHRSGVRIRVTRQSGPQGLRMGRRVHD